LCALLLLSCIVQTEIHRKITSTQIKKIYLVYLPQKISCLIDKFILLKIMHLSLYMIYLLKLINIGYDLSFSCYLYSDIICYAIYFLAAWSRWFLCSKKLYVKVCDENNNRISGGSFLWMLFKMHCGVNLRLQIMQLRQRWSL